VQHGRCVERQQIKGRAAIPVHAVNMMSTPQAPVRLFIGMRRPRTTDQHPLSTNPRQEMMLQHQSKNSAATELCGCIKFFGLP
jgi:hypothetical protein